MPSGTCLDSTDTPAQGTYPREQQGGFELEEILLSPHEAIRDVYYLHPPPYPACATNILIRTFDSYYVALCPHTYDLHSRGFRGAI